MFKNKSMKRKIASLFTGVFLVALTLCTLSCKKMFDLSPEDALEYDKAYQNVFDADAAVWGIYGKFVGIADRYMVLNELRADLEDVTPQTEKFLREMNDHVVSQDNPWASPRPFYEIIINCNDALSNFDKMLADKRLTQEEYNIRYSEVGAVRTWVYLQLGIHFGSIPYVTEPLASIKDVQDESKYPKISFDQLLTNLVLFMENLPNKEPIPSGSTLLRNLDGYSTEKMFVNKYCLMGDLHLWKENWNQAAVYYHKMMNYAEVLYPARNSEQYYEVYKVGSQNGNANMGNWDRFFEQPYNERYSNYENIWMIPFDKNFSPSNPFINLYAKIGGNYQIKPSAFIIKQWDNQNRVGGSIIDIHRGEENSYRNRNMPEILKLIPNYDSNQPFETGGKWILYRAALVHLRMSEVAANVGYDKIAHAFLNHGLLRGFDPTYNVNTRSRANRNRNVTNIMQTVSDVNSPFYFDAREGDAPSFRSPWYRNQGIRDRVGLLDANVDSVKFFDFSAPGNPNKAVTNRPGLTRAMEDLLIDEAALELAFEGNRWQDLLRIALRRKSVDPNYLANKIAAKFEASGDMATATAVRTRLANEANWYLPFKWQ